MLGPGNGRQDQHVHEFHGGQSATKDIHWTNNLIKKKNYKCYERKLYDSMNVLTRRRSSSVGSWKASLRKWNLTQDLKNGSRQTKQHLPAANMLVSSLLVLLFPPLLSPSIFLLIFFPWFFLKFLHFTMLCWVLPYNNINHP